MTGLTTAERTLNQRTPTLVDFVEKLQYVELFKGHMIVFIFLNTRAESPTSPYWKMES